MGLFWVSLKEHGYGHEHRDAEFRRRGKFPGGLQQKTYAVHGENTMWFASIRRLSRFPDVKLQRVLGYAIP